MVSKVKMHKKKQNKYLDPDELGREWAKAGYPVFVGVFRAADNVSFIGRDPSKRKRKGKNTPLVMITNLTCPACGEGLKVTVDLVEVVGGRDDGAVRRKDPCAWFKCGACNAIIVWPRDEQPRAPMGIPRPGDP